MQEQQSNLSSINCMFCMEETGAGFTIMMNQALQSKHAINKYQNYSAYIDVLLKIEEPCNAAEAWEQFQYKQYLIADEEEQFMKRSYGQDQFDGKINMLTQYYKFHSNIPRIIQPRIQRILSRYYDKKRQYDYKKIKKLLKQEQGLSITSVQQSQSSLEESNIEKKSRYSTLLNQLQHTQLKNEQMTDSKLLKDMCRQIELVLPSKKNDKHFQIKGNFDQDKMFQLYLKQEETRFREKLKQKNGARLVFNKQSKRLNLQQLLKKGRQKYNKQTIQSNLGANYPLRESRQMKRKEKDKFIYNTNIKIQIKNAMFYSNGQKPLQLKNLQFQDKVQNKFKKRNFFNNLNLYDVNPTNKKNLIDIYKPHQKDRDFKRKSFTSQSRQRILTKESINNSKGKQRKKTIPKEQSQPQLKRSVAGALSARKIVYSTNQWNRSKSTTNHQEKPVKNLSSGNLKKRSLSTNNGFSMSNNGITGSTSSLNKKNERIIEKRPIQSISRYGSSDMRSTNPHENSNFKLKDRQSKTISIKDILNKKLTLKFS